MLEVEVLVDADFEKENLHSVVVDLRYNEVDHFTGGSRQAVKGLLFTAGAGPQFFRVTMALDAEGHPIDTYSVIAQAHYKNKPQPVTLMNRQGVNDRQLVIVPRRKEQRTVVFQAGAIDWPQVRTVALEVALEGGRKATPSEIRLSAGEARAFCSFPIDVGKEEPFRYRLRIAYANGVSAETEWIDSTGDIVVIDDPFRKKRSGVVELTLDQNTVKAVQVDVRYQEQRYGITERESHRFTQSGTWNWSLAVMAPGPHAPAYRYAVEYVDGESRHSEWEEIDEEEKVIRLNVRRYPYRLQLDAGKLDWAKWRKVYLTVRYEDPAHGYEESALIQLDPDQPGATFPILAFEESSPTFTYEARFAPLQGQVVHQSGKTIEGLRLELEEPQ